MIKVCKSRSFFLTTINRAIADLRSQARTAEDAWWLGRSAKGVVHRPPGGDGGGANRPPFASAFFDLRRSGAETHPPWLRGSGVHTLSLSNRGLSIRGELRWGPPITASSSSWSYRGW